MRQEPPVPLAVVRARFISQLERDTPQVAVPQANPAAETTAPTRTEWNQWVRDLLSYDIDLERAVQSGTQITRRADKSHLRDLYALLKLDDPFVMGIVSEPLVRLQGPVALPILLRVQRSLELAGLDGSHLTVVTRDVISAYPKECYAILIGLLGDPAISVRRDAVWAMSFLPPVEAVSQLLQLLRDPHKEVRIAATYTLKHFHAEIVIDALIRMLRDSDAEIRCAAIDSLRHLGDRRALSALEDARRDRDAAVRAFAREACQHMTATLAGNDATALKPQSPNPVNPPQAAKNPFLNGLRSAILSVSRNSV